MYYILGFRCWFRFCVWFCPKEVGIKWNGGGGYISGIHGYIPGIRGCIPGSRGYIPGICGYIPGIRGCIPGNGT